MKHLTIAIVVVAALAVGPPVVGAQSQPAEPGGRGPDQGDLIHAVKTLQAQVAFLQKQLNATMGDTRLGIYADIAYGGLGAAIINGWAFKCGPTPTPGTGEPAYKLDLLIDGMPAPHKYIIRSDRPDVQTLYAPYCGADGMPSYTGFSMLVDLGHFDAGLHSFNVRIKDRRGAAETSNGVTAPIR